MRDFNTILKETLKPSGDSANQLYLAKQKVLLEQGLAGHSNVSEDVIEAKYGYAKTISQIEEVYKISEVTIKICKTLLSDPDRFKLCATKYTTGRMDYNSPVVEYVTEIMDRKTGYTFELDSNGVAGFSLREGYLFVRCVDEWFKDYSKKQVVMMKEKADSELASIKHTLNELYKD